MYRRQMLNILKLSYIHFFSRYLADGNSRLQEQMDFRAWLPGEPEPGDDLYQKYRVPLFIGSERGLLSNVMKMTKDERAAFTIANKADVAVQYHRPENAEEARKMAMHSLKLDPFCTDGLRVLCKTIPILELTAQIHGFREVLRFIRPRFEEYVKPHPGEFYMLVQTRQYLRVIFEIADSSQQLGYYEEACWGYEEMLRLNHHDNKQVSGRLLPMYITVMGLNKNSPKRTMTHIKALMSANLTGGQRVFDENDVAIRWAKIFIAWYERKDWQSLAKAEYSRCQWAFRQIFKEIETIPRAVPKPGEVPFTAGDYIVGSDQDDARRLAPHYEIAFSQWPEFTNDLHKCIRGCPQPKGSDKRNVRDEMRKMGSQTAIIAKHMLDKGRESLRMNNIEDALNTLCISKQCYEDAAKAMGKRWYEIAEFAVASNRATCNEYLGDFNLCRYDSRFTLVMKPDHERTYQRIPKIARVFESTQVVERADALLERIGKGVKHTAAEWRQFAKEGIMLLGLAALTLGRVGKLTPEKAAELAEIGVDDCFTSVNWPESLHPHLPWLKESDMQPQL